MLCYTIGISIVIIIELLYNQPNNLPKTKII
jgi:hypothetical protein